MGEFLTKVNNVTFLDCKMFGMERYNGAYLIETGSSLIMIDTGTTAKWDSIKEDLDDLGYSPRDIAAIFCTHPEHNYSGGNAFHFAEENPDIVIYANPLDARELTNPELEIERRKTAWTSDAKRAAAGVPGRVPVKNVRMFEDGEIIDIDGYQIVCIYAPGHQPGNSSFYDPQNKMMFLGDMLGIYLPDLEVMYPINPDGANFNVLRESLCKMQDYDIEWVAAAHCGFGSDPDLIQKAIEMYTAYLAMGEEKMKAGKADEIYDACMEFFQSPMEIIASSSNIGRGEALVNYAMKDHLPPQARRFQQQCEAVYFPQYAQSPEA